MKIYIEKIDGLLKLRRILDAVDKIYYNSSSVGCGIEDAGITDRYESAEYGFEECKRLFMEAITNELP